MERYSEYKDSGVQWLGEIPSHWKTTRLGKIVTLKTGTTPSFYELEVGESSVSWYTPSDFEESFVLGESSRKLDKASFDAAGYSYIPSNSVLIIGIGGTAGKTAMTKKPCYTNQQITSIIPKSVINSLFLLLYLRSIRLVLLNTAHYTTLPILNNVFLSQTNIPLPTKEEQQAIVSYLDTKCSKLDTFISNKEKEITLLQEMKQRVITDAVTRGLNPNVKFKPTNIPWLPEIPEHWEEKRLSTQFTGDVQVNKDFTVKHAFKFNYGELVPKNEVGAPEEYRDVYVRYSLIKEGDVLINGLNLNYDFVSQRVACAPADGIITSAYVVCRPRKNVNYNYYTLLFKAMDSIKLFHGMGSGIRLTLSFKELKKQLLPVPPIEEQHAIVSYITERTAKIDSLIEKLNKEIECVKEYKQRLISDVVTGQIKVS